MPQLLHIDIEHRGDLKGESLGKEQLAESKAIGRLAISAAIHGGHMIGRKRMMQA